LFFIIDIDDIVIIASKKEKRYYKNIVPFYFNI